MNIAFFGTPSFAIPSLLALVKSKGFKVVCVVTGPDKPVGRGGKIQYSDVKRFALEHNIPVLQPERISRELHILDPYNVDCIVTCAFGQILRQNVLDYCKYGVINVHGSLLPKYRGSSPIQWAIINGEVKTGITIMQTDIGMDSGDIILQHEVDINPGETAGELFERLGAIGAGCLVEALRQIKDGEAVRIPQNHAEATHFPMLKKEDGKIDWTRNATQIANQVRGMNPWPGAFFQYEGEVLRLHKSERINQNSVAKFGNVIKADKAGLWVKCGEGILSLEVLQAAGGKKLSYRDFLNGRPIKTGVIFE